MLLQLSGSNSETPPHKKTVLLKGSGDDDEHLWPSPPFNPLHSFSPVPGGVTEQEAGRKTSLLHRLRFGLGTQ